MKTEQARPIMKAIKIIGLSVVAVMALAAALWFALPRDYLAAGDKAEKICAQATAGDRYADFRDGVFRSGLAKQKPVEIPFGDEQISAFADPADMRFSFAEWAVIGKTCTVHAKDGVIIKKEVSEVRLTVKELFS
jgi:hypothetical protein